MVFLYIDVTMYNVYYMHTNASMYVYAYALQRHWGFDHHLRSFNPTNPLRQIEFTVYYTFDYSRLGHIYFCKL